MKEANTGEVQKYLEAFQDSHKILSDAALLFREQLTLSQQECRSMVHALQILRQKTDACLTFFEQTCWPCSSTDVLDSLALLDGEKTARLILEVDLFRTLLVRGTLRESLSQAQERIGLHVRLEGQLKQEAKYIRELLTHLETFRTVTESLITLDTNK